MPRSPAQLRSDALAIWHAAVEAVRSDRLVKQNVRVDSNSLLIGDSVVGTLRVPSTQTRSVSEGLTELALPLSSINRIAVVGAGKAGAGMAAGLEVALGPKILAEKQLTGWINVPADCVPSVIGTRAPTQWVDVPLPPDGTRSLPTTIHLHPARPAGLNEPTPEGVFGAEKILEIVSSLGPDDLCFCLLSGGASALLPAPIAGVSLAEKQTITRLLSEGGANIEELNTVRKQLSRIKGGGLARACHAGRLITLIISDVLGDPLDVIASGPTVPNSRTPQDALAILQRYTSGNERAAPAAFAHLRKKAAAVMRPSPPTCQVTNLIIGNNALAVDAAGIEAERRGYSHAMLAATSLEGPAEDIGRDLARTALKMCSESGPDCLITGGEPTVKLAPPEIRGKGGRNQQVVLAALVELIGDLGLGIWDSQRGNPKSQIPNPKFCLLSAGTDGEDGPTDAAGAIIDADTISRTRAQSLDPADFLRCTDAYQFFDRLDGLIKTGPTHTNVCDVRVVVVDRN